MANDTVETNTTPALDEQDVWPTGPDGEQIPNYEATFPTINEGEVVHGKVVLVDPDDFAVDDLTLVDRGEGRLVVGDLLPVGAGRPDIVLGECRHRVRVNCFVGHAERGS